MNTKEAIRKAIDMAGTQARLAELIGNSQPNISDWVRGKTQVPLSMCIKIEKAFKGQINRRELRDDWRDHWEPTRKFK